jgi:hypothetical protein
MFDDIDGVIRSRNSNEQYNGQQIKNMMPSNDLQNTTQKTNAWGTRPHKTGSELEFSERSSSSCSFRGKYNTAMHFVRGF